MANVPWPGEFSIPLTDEARENASFELEARPKGVFLESYYRRALNTVGLHAFVGDDRRQGAASLRIERASRITLGPSR